MNNNSSSIKIKYIAIGLVWVVALIFYISVFMRDNQAISDDFVKHIKSGFSLISHMKNGIVGLSEYKKVDPYSAIISYPVWHILVYAIYRIGNFVFPFISQGKLQLISAAIVNATAIALTLVVLLRVFQKENDSKKTTILKTIICASLLFVGPIDASFFIGKYYLGAYTGNPWHNPTYLVVRVVAIVVFYMYVKIFKVKEPTVRQYVQVSILLLFSAFCKPNFYQVFLPGLVVFCILLFLIKRNKDTFAKCLKIALTCVPTIALLFIQFFLSISGEGGRGIGFKFLFVWKHYTQNWLLSLLVSIAFPLVVYIILFIKKRVDYSCMLCLFVFISALVQYMFFYIKTNPFYADFSWGFELSIFLLFVVAMKKLLEIIQLDGFKVKFSEKIGLFIYGLHLLFGIFYFTSIFYTLEYGRLFRIMFKQ